MPQDTLDLLLLNDSLPLDPRIREAMKSDVISPALCVLSKIKDRVIGVLNLSKLGGLPSPRAIWS